MVAVAVLPLTLTSVGAVVVAEPEAPEEKKEPEAPQINVNLDSEYFKWKEQGEKPEIPDVKQPEKKSIFGKFIK